MSFHDRINSLRKSQYWDDEFSAGYDQAKFEAAQIAKAADELMAEMAEELKWYRADSDADCVLKKYESWKEQNQ